MSIYINERKCYKSCTEYREGYGHLYYMIPMMKYSRCDATYKNLLGSGYRVLWSTMLKLLSIST